MTKSLFPIIMGLEDIAKASELIQFLASHKISDTDELRTYRPESFYEKGTVHKPALSRETYQKFAAVIQERNISLLPTLKVPFDVLYKTAPEKVAMEIQLYGQFKELRTIDDFMEKITRSDLVDDEVSQLSVDHIAQILEKEYCAQIPVEENSGLPSIRHIRGYPVIRNDDHFIVNGKRLEISDHGNALPAEVVEKIYRYHSEGTGINKILKKIGPPLRSIQSINKHLMRAGVYNPNIPDAAETE